MVQPDVRADRQVNFQLPKYLLFGVSQKKISPGDIFNQDDIPAPAAFDLDRFPGGLVVTLTQDPASGKYVFSSSH